MTHPSDRPRKPAAPDRQPPAVMPQPQPQADPPDPPARLRGHGPLAPGSPEPADDHELALPHERDESTGSASTGQGGRGEAGRRQRRVMQQAADDLAQGQVDTDLHATPGLDAERRDALLAPATPPVTPPVTPSKRRG